MNLAKNSLPAESQSGAAELQPRRWYHDTRRIWAVLAIVIVIWGLTDVRRRGRLDPNNISVHKTDFTVYTEAGAAFFDARDPYAVKNVRGWHYLYPPLFAIAVAPLSALPSQAQVVVFYFISVAACIGTWFESRRIVRFLIASLSRGNARLSLPVWMYYVIGLTVLFPVLNCLQRGQVGVLLMYLLMLGLRLLLESRHWCSALAAGIVLALPVAIKLTPAMPVGFLLLAFALLAWFCRGAYGTTVGEQVGYGWMARTFSLATGQLTGLVLFLIVLPGLAVGQRENIGHLQTWMNRVVTNDELAVDNTFDDQSKRNQSLANGARLLVETAGAVVAPSTEQSGDKGASTNASARAENATLTWIVRVIALGVVGLLLAAGWQTAKRRDLLGLVALFGLASVGSLVVSPISWGHHYAIMLPAVLFVPLWCVQQNQLRRAQLLTCTACALVVAHYLVLDVAGAIGLLGIGTACWYTFAVYSVGWKATAPSAGAQNELLRLKAAGADTAAAQAPAVNRPQTRRAA